MAIRVLFVCFGNICRSPAAHGVFEDLVGAAGLSQSIEVDSAGTTGFHSGQQADKRMREHAKKRGYTLASLSRKIHANDLETFDKIIVMDDKNLKDVTKINPALENKIGKLTQYCTRHTIDHVPDPYFGGAAGFEQVLDIVEDACENLLNDLKHEINRD
ncbi:MAG: phosphotyrosine protein phosphatase [Halobacteriovorax sp.]|nr:phosphotyrosine protein phosphatase [Halobacteriovorax sp.]